MIRLVRIRPPDVAGHSSLLMTIPVGVNQGECARVLSVVAAVQTDATVGSRVYALSVRESQGAGFPVYKQPQVQDIAASSIVNLNWDELSQLQAAGTTPSLGVQRATIPCGVFEKDFSVILSSTAPASSDNTTNVEVLVAIGTVEEILS